MEEEVYVFVVCGRAFPDSSERQSGEEMSFPPQLQSTTHLPHIASPFRSHPRPYPRPCPCHLHHPHPINPLHPQPSNP